MKLYYNPQSSNCLKVVFVAHHLDLKLDLEPLDFMKGDMKKPEFLKINPNGMVPALVDGDFNLWESNAMMQYLADKKSGNTLWPEDKKTRVDISRWLFWQASHWSQSLHPFLWENLYKKMMNAGSPDPHELKKGEEKFQRFAGVLNHHLEGRQYIVGNQLTLADVAIASPLLYAKEAKVPLSDYRHIQDHYARFEKLAAWKKAVNK